MQERTRQLVVWGMIAVVVAGVATAVFQGVIRRGPPALTAAERAPLIDEVVAGKHRLRHPAFGITFQHPGDGYTVAQQVLDSMRSTNPSESLAYYAYADTPLTGVVMLVVTRAEVDSREDLQTQFDGFESTFGTKSPPTVLERSVLWDAGKHEVDYHATIKGMHYRMRLVAMHTPHGGVLAALMVISADPDAHADVLASLGQAN